MRIALDGLALGNRGGTGRYVELLVDGFAALAAEDFQLWLLVREDYPVPEAWGAAAHIHVETAPLVCRPSAWKRALQPMQRSRFIGLWLQGLREGGAAPEIVHGPAFVLPPLPPGAAGVVTVHDLAFRLYPETLPRMRQSYLSRAVPDSMQRARLVLTDCDAVAKQIRAIYPGCVEQDSVQSIPLAVAPPKPTGPQKLTALRRRFGLGDRYWLTLSTLEPRKNLSRLVEAYARVAQTENPPQWVMAGRRGWGCTEIDRAIAASQLGERIQRIGHLSEEDREALLAGAELFLAPSIYEGCDLPPMEAAACGALVVASDIPAHRQMLPKGTEFLNPYDIAGWTLVLRRYAASPPATRVSGTLRTPQDLARQTLAAYREVL